MDILKNKVYESYNYLNRYTTVPYYYNTVDRREIYGIGTNVYKTTSYTAVAVEVSDTLDSLALKYYNNPTFWWLIAYFNDIQDSFICLWDNYDVIKIPDLASLSFGNERE